MKVAVDLKDVRALDAMWLAFRASQSTAQTQVEISTSVVRDMLNARFLNPSQGQFLTEDPVMDRYS